MIAIDLLSLPPGPRLIDALSSFLIVGFWLHLILPPAMPNLQVEIWMIEKALLFCARDAASTFYMIARASCAEAAIGNTTTIAHMAINLVKNIGFKPKLPFL